MARRQRTARSDDYGGLAQVAANVSCTPAGSAQTADDHCHCVRWPLDTLGAVCNGYNGAANGGGVTVDGRFYPGCPSQIG